MALTIGTGHVARLPNERLPKKIFYDKLVSQANELSVA